MENVRFWGGCACGMCVCVFVIYTGDGRKIGVGYVLMGNVRFWVFVRGVRVRCMCVMYVWCVCVCVLFVCES